MSTKEQPHRGPGTAPGARPDRPLLGAVFMIIGVLFIAMQEASAKLLLEGGMPLAQVIWARYVVHLALVLAVFTPRHGLSVFRSGAPRAQIGRSMLLVLDTGFYFLGLLYLSLVEVTALVFIAPILVVVLSVPLLRERMDWGKAMLALAGFGGVLLIVRPFGSESGVGLGWPALTIVAAAVCIALFNIWTRKLRAADPTPVTMVYTALVGAVCASFIAPFFWRAPDWEEVGLILALGTCGAIGHGLFIVAHQEAPASTVAPFMYVQILWALGLGWLVFGDWPDLWTFVGAAVIILSGAMILRRARGKT